MYIFDKIDSYITYTHNPYMLVRTQLISYTIHLLLSDEDIVNVYIDTDKHFWNFDNLDGQF